MKNLKISNNEWLKQKISEAKNINFVRELDFSDKEIIDNLLEIFSCYEQKQECLNYPFDECINDGYHKYFYRDENGNLKTGYVICDKQEKINKEIKKRQFYLFKDFSEKYDYIGLNKHDVMTTGVDKSRNNLLVQLRKQIKKQNFHGFYLYGEMGVGKSHLMICFSNELVNLGKTVAYISLKRLFENIKRTFNNFDDVKNAMLDKIVNNLKNADFLIIDDIGYEDFSQYFHMNLLLDVFLFRFDEQKPTYFISNRSLTDLENYYYKKNNIINNKYDKVSVQKFIDSIKSLTKNETYFVQGKNLRY